MELTELKTFGKQDSDRPDVLLTCQHDGDHEELLDEYPQIRELYADNPQVLEDYLNLERDLGARRITLETAKELERLSGGDLRIDVLDIKLPRGIVDSNRVPLAESDSSHNPSGVSPNPIRKVFDHDAHPELVEDLTELHKQMIAAIRTAIANLSEDGLFMDIHTMMDHDIKNGDPDEPPSIQESPGVEGLKTYIEKLTNPKKLGRKRKVNIITSFHNRPPISNMSLVKNLEDEYEGEDLETEQNLPYSFLGFSTCSQMALQRPRRGVAIDIPIGHISKVAERNYINPELSEEKIKKVAHANARAIWNTISHNNGQAD